LDKAKARFFIALLPPVDIQDYVSKIKQHFAERYASKSALKSPPHITLQPPFEWLLEQVPVMEASLKAFATMRSPIPITLSGFSAFAPRVIYINVLKTPELLTLQQELMSSMEAELGIPDTVSKQRPFAPHMTVAFRDLTRQNFKAAWPEFQHRQLHFEFASSNLTLLIHDGKRWNIKSEFPFGDE
jgi:2'-5' RNA ligase